MWVIGVAYSAFHYHDYYFGSRFVSFCVWLAVKWYHALFNPHFKVMRCKIL